MFGNIIGVLFIQNKKVSLEVSQHFEISFSKQKQLHFKILIITWGIESETRAR